MIATMFSNPCARSILYGIHASITGNQSRRRWKETRRAVTVIVARQRRPRILRKIFLGYNSIGSSSERNQMNAVEMAHCRDAATPRSDSVNHGRIPSIPSKSAERPSGNDNSMRRTTLNVVKLRHTSGIVALSGCIQS